MTLNDLCNDTMSFGLQFGQFFNSGQVCSATSRLLVHEKIASQFLAMLKERAESIRICDPLDPDCRQGAVVSGGQYAKILHFIKVSTPNCISEVQALHPVSLQG
jgi:acyl-CoA reductase-like NAD-dependent aldehyde dehydrogenase